MLPRHRLRPSRLALCLLAALAAPVHAADVLQEAGQLLSEQRGQEAYALLSPLEDERGGDPAYDYLLGRAAMASGRHTEAAFAFERCLSSDPKNGECRLQMAQAHMLLGETVQARAELKTIQDYNPPAEVSALVGQYLGALQQKEQQARRQLGVYAQLGLGHDSNVNSANDDRLIAIPALGGLFFVKSPSAREQDDNVARLEAGLRWNQSVSPAWRLLADASLNQHLYQDLDAYNSLSLDGSVGGAWQTGPRQVVLKANAQSYQLDGEDYRQLVGGTAQYLHAVGDTAQASVYLQSTMIRYDTQSLRDTRRDTLGAAWSQALTGGRQPVVYLGLYGGQETPDSSDPVAAHFGQRFVGLRSGGSLFFGPRLQLTASLNVEDRQFDDREVLFLAAREDTQYDVGLGLAYRLNRYLSVRPNLSFTRNTSSIVINEFTRHTASVDFRYER